MKKFYEINAHEVCNRVLDNICKSEEIIITEEIKREKPKFLGLITQYPVQLHSAYSECFSLWISICSLKLKLNAVVPDDEELAYEIQTDMLRNIHRFDRLKSALEHYNQYKEVLLN